MPTDLKPPPNLAEVQRVVAEAMVRLAVLHGYPASETARNLIAAVLRARWLALSPLRRRGPRSNLLLVDAVGQHFVAVRNYEPKLGEPFLMRTEAWFALPAADGVLLCDDEYPFLKEAP